MKNYLPLSKTTVFIILFFASIVLLSFLLYSPTDHYRSIFTIIAKENTKKIIYASPSGAGTFDGSNPNNSTKGLQSALDIVKPNETIELSAGDYFEDVSTKTHGKKNELITIYGPKEAIVRGSKNHSRIFQVLHDYYVLDNFSINGYNPEKPVDDENSYSDKLLYVNGTKEAYDGKTKRGPTGVEIKNMNLSNAGGECIRLRYYVTEASIHDNQITNCGFYDFKFTGQGKNGEGIYIGTSSEQWDDDKNPTDGPDKTNKNHIFNNTINTNGNECVEIKEGGENNLVEKNICSGGQDKDAGALTARGNNNIFRFNQIYNNKGCGIRFGGHEEKGKDYGVNNSAYGNTIYNNDYCGIKIMAKKQDKICENIFVGPNQESQDHIIRGDYEKEYIDRVDKKCK